MPYQFDANLEPGQFTPLDNCWLKNLKRILKKAKLNSIKQFSLVRLLRMNYIGNCKNELKNSNEDVMNEAVTDTNGSSYLVNLDQVYYVIGEEDWIHGKVNCLSTLASSWTITLSWGAKWKESINQRSVLSVEGLQVGDHVAVENHDKQWPHKAEIVDIDMENNTAWIRWEMTWKKDLVDLGDLA
jgi:hypothetical protein